jgi:PIN domain nuclease of toxin-antitoxin system
VGFIPLDVSIELAVDVVDLPSHHADAFDRMLMVQVPKETLGSLRAGLQMAIYSPLVLLV